MTPRVSIVLPTYNRPDLLRRALQTIADQTYEDFECIVVNDAGMYVGDIVNKFKRTALINRTINGGLSAARNTGLKAARGYYVTYQDDDDIWFPEHLGVLVEHLDTLPHIRAAFTDCYRWYNEKFLFPGKQTSGGIGKNGKKIAAIICLMHERSCLDEVGYFDESMRCMEDWDFIIRLSRKCGIFHIPQFTAAYSKRMDLNQLSSDEAKMKAAYDVIRERHGIDPPKYRAEIL